MRRVVVDTNVFIDWRRKKAGVLGKLMDLSRKGKIEILLPTVVIMEYWVGREIDDKGLKARAERMFEGFVRVGLTELIAKKAGEILRKNKVGQPMDAVVAATSLIVDAELATRNERHFEKVKGLRFYYSTSSA